MSPLQTLAGSPPRRARGLDRWRAREVDREERTAVQLASRARRDRGGGGHGGSGAREEGGEFEESSPWAPLDPRASREEEVELAAGELEVDSAGEEAAEAYGGGPPGMEREKADHGRQERGAVTPPCRGEGARRRGRGGGGGGGDVRARGDSGADEDLAEKTRRLDRSRKICRVSL
nr:unnamed protein product [Digitaria exilis]